MRPPCPPLSVGPPIVRCSQASGPFSSRALRTSSSRLRMTFAPCSKARCCRYAALQPWCQFFEPSELAAQPLAREHCLCCAALQRPWRAGVHSPPPCGQTLLYQLVLRNASDLPSTAMCS